MTVDLLAATFFWPEGTLFGALHPHPHELEAAAAGAAGPERAPEHREHPERPEAADAAARAEGFWAAMVRHLWRPSDAAALP